MFEQALDTALQAARAAAAVHQKNFGQVRIEHWSPKGTADFVTHVDREAEAEIVRIIRAAFPHHVVLAEEAASAAQQSESSGAIADWTWLVDPLDGTTNYLHRYP